MKRFLLFICIAMNVGVVFFVSGCQSPKVGEYEFDYYPERNVYYNVQTAKFHYSLDGGKTWEEFKADVKADSTLLGKSEKIYSKSPEVWKENGTHLNMYEGKVYTIVDDNDKSFAVTGEEVSDKRIISSGSGGSSGKQSAAPAKKKGLKGFFNRIFGKKDKK